MTHSTYCYQIIAAIALTIPLICNASYTLASSVSAGAKNGLQITQSGGSFEHQRDTRRGSRSQIGKGNSAVSGGNIPKLITHTSSTPNRCTKGKSITKRGCRSQLGKIITTESHGDLEKIIARTTASQNRHSEDKSLNRRGCRSQLEKCYSIASRSGLIE